MQAIARIWQMQSCWAKMSLQPAVINSLAIALGCEIFHSLLVIYGWGQSITGQIGKEDQFRPPLN